MSPGLAASIGFAAGWLGSIPVAGPISALVVTRGLEGRFRSGLFISLGAGLVEALYALLAFWGFSTYLARYPLVTPVSRAGGAIVLFALAVTFYRRPPPSPLREPPKAAALGSFFLGATICALNPTLIATWTAVVASLHGAGLHLTPDAALPFAVGCALGIAGWFVTLLLLLRRYRTLLSGSRLAWVMRGVSLLLFATAVWFCWQIYRDIDAQSRRLGPTRVLRVARATTSPEASSMVTGTS
ncbi:MAG: LysE family transporter [Polyangiaceae bacterium]